VADHPDQFAARLEREGVDHLLLQRLFLDFVELDLDQFVPEQALGESRRLANVLSYAHMKEIEYVEKGEKKIIHYAEIGKEEMGG